MFRELTVIAVIVAVVAVLVLRARYARMGAGDPGGTVSRFPRIETLAALLCGATFLGLTLTGFYDLLVHNRVMHSYVLLAHVGLGGAFTAALAAMAFLRAEANGPGTGPRIPGVGLRKAGFWLFTAAGLALVLTAALAMIPWLGTHGQHRIIDFHRWAALVSLVAGIGYAGLKVKRRREPIRSVGEPKSPVPAQASAKAEKPAAAGPAAAVQNPNRGQNRNPKKSGRNDRRQPAGARGR